MNDQDLITTMRESFTDVQSATPVEQIVSRSQVIRARRRIPVAVAVVAVAAAAGTAVALIPAAWSRSITADHEDPSAYAPWTSTTLRTLGVEAACAVIVVVSRVIRSAARARGWAWPSSGPAPISRLASGPGRSECCSSGL